MKKQRPTQQDVADAAGVHRTTVSLALKNSPHLPAATREKIHKLAKQLGYVPDPMLTALTAYRKAARPAAYQGSLVWLVNNNPIYQYDWRAPAIVQIYNGAALAARDHGYNMEVVNLWSDHVTPRRVASILKARNVQGLVLPPQPRPNTVLEFPWEEFSAVTIGHSLANPQFHLVTAAQYRSMREVVGRLQSRGYKRIGLVFTTNQDGKTDHNYLAGFLIGHYKPEGMTFLPPLISFTDRPEPEVFMEWYRKHKPDVIIAGHKVFLEFARQMKLRIPEEVGVACLQIMDRQGELAGISENGEGVGRAAVNQVVSMIMQGEKGIPKHPIQIAMEGEWVEGSTLRPIPA